MLGPMRSSLSFLAVGLLFVSTSTSAATTQSKYARQAEFLRVMKAATHNDPVAQRQLSQQRHLRQQKSKERFERNLLKKAVTREEAERQAGILPFISSSKNRNRALEDAAAANDDYYAAAANDDANYNQNNYNYNNNNQNQQQQQDVDYGSFGFDPSSYSLKYTACSTISLYSDNLAEDEDATSVTKAKKFVVFRLCPSDTCKSYYTSEGTNYDGSRGCGDSYGEYLVPLEAYVEEYAKYKEEASEAYCQYCEQCVYFEKYYYGNRQRQLEDGNYKAVADDDMYYANGNNNGQQQQQQEEQHACKHYNECQTYQDVCEVDDADQQDQQQYQQYADDAAANDDAYQYQQQQQQQEEINFEDFYYCKQVEDNGNDYNGNQYYYNGLYIGPRCAADGITIEFGVFSDEDCTNYIGDKVSVQDAIGIQDFGYDFLTGFYDQECVSCRASDMPYKINEDENQDENDISEVCEMLYQSSAKCNVNLEDAQAASYMYANQYRNEASACSFIDNVARGKYGEDGFVKSPRFNYDIRKWFQNYEDDVPPSIGQIFIEVGLIVACTIMLITICFMQRSLNKWNNAKRRRALMEKEDDGSSDYRGVRRLNSGVMSGRSYSGEYPEDSYVMQ